MVKQIFVVLLLLAIATSSLAERQPGTTVSDDETARRRRLADARLIREYEATGLAIQHTYALPTDQSISRPVFRNGPGDQADIARFHAMRDEILRRGKMIAPELIGFLRNEVPKRRTAEPDAKAVPGFVGDAVDLLVEMRDPRAADVLVEVLDGFGGKAAQNHRNAALNGLERLTYCSFRTVRPFSGNYGDAVEHATAVKDGELFRSKAADRYRNWLKGEGRDPAKWLSIARTRARTLVESDDQHDIYCAATFLRPQGGADGKLPDRGRDSDPKATMNRLANIMGQFTKTDNPHYYSWKDQTGSVPIANWMLSLSRYGKQAQPHAGLLVRFQKGLGLDNWGGFAMLGEVGGHEVLSYLFECLPRVKGTSMSTCRIAIDRIANRSFANDNERQAWWKKNMNKIRTQTKNVATNKQ